MGDPREPLGRLVHDVRLACEAGRAEAEGRQRFILPPWEERDDWQRELDMQIGATIAAAEYTRIRDLAERCEAVGTSPGGRNTFFTRIMDEEASGE